MPQEWFVRRGKNEQGPLTSQELRQLVAKGTIVPSDFVRTTDKPDWREAGTIKGLFNEDASARKTPPPLPKSSIPPTAPSIPLLPTSPTKAAKSTPPPLPESLSARTSGRVVPQIPSSKSATAKLTVYRRPKLTGFMMAVSVSVDGLFHGSIGGGLLRGLIDLLASKENSLELSVSPGNHDVEVSGGGLKGSMSLDMTIGRQYDLITYFSNLGMLGGGLRLEAMPKGTVDSKHLKSQVPQDKRWSVKGVMKVGILCMGLLLPLLGAIRGYVESSESANVSIVKQGQMDAYPGATVGQLVDNFLASPQWSEGTGENGEKFVNANGEMTFHDKPVEAEIRFIVQGQRFELHAFEMNGIPQNGIIKAALFRKMYDEYRK